MPQSIIGGFAFAREHHPAVMKFAFPFTSVPTSMTGMGMKKLEGILTFSIRISPAEF
jgi:hypothetical protein